MIISHKYKFIFIKTNKTAGTSVEIALSKYCGDNDIITPIIMDDEEKRKELGYRGPQNFQIRLKHYRLTDYINLLRGKKKEFYHHMPASEIQKYIDEDIWNDYYKFTIERNPFDRVISFYYWKFPDEPRISLLDFLNSKIIYRLKQWGISGYTIDGKCAVDKVCLFENLTDEIEYIRHKLGIHEQIELPRTKNKTRKNKLSACELIQEKEKQIIEEIFADELTLYNYSFESICNR